MTTLNDEEMALRQRKSTAVAVAVARLVDKLGYEPDIVFEGAIRGACIALLRQGVPVDDVATLLKNAGRLVGTLDQDN